MKTLCIAATALLLLCSVPVWAQTTPAHFSVAYYSGAPLSGLPMGTVVYSFRNAGPDTITINCVGLGAISAAPTNLWGWLGLEMVVARNFTASPTGGQSLILPLNGYQNRLDSDSANMTVADVRWSAGSNTMALGAVTLDAVGIANGAGGVTPNAPAGTVVIPLHMVFESSDAAPLVLHPNEGFVIRTFSFWPTGLSANIFFDVKWTET